MTFLFTEVNITEHVLTKSAVGPFRAHSACFRESSNIFTCFSCCVLTLEVSDCMQACNFGKGGECALQDQKCILGSFWVFCVSFAVTYSLYKQESSRMGKREVEIVLTVQCAWPVWLSGWLWTHSPRVGTIVFPFFIVEKMDIERLSNLTKIYQLASKW